MGSLPLSVLEDKPRTLYAQRLPGDQTFRSPVSQFTYLVSMVIQCWQVRNNSVFDCQALQWMAQGGFWGDMGGGAWVDVKVTTTELGDGHHLPLLARCRFRHVRWPAVPFAGRSTTGNDTPVLLLCQ